MKSLKVKLKAAVIFEHSVGIFTIDSVGVRGSIRLVSGLEDKISGCIFLLGKITEMYKLE